jgi:ADP-ribose pyrophosphatase YjhB (NUDIX family)
MENVTEGQTDEQKATPAMSLNISVDCVLVGFDGEQFRVLLIRQDEKRQQEGLHNLKLPGSLIYDDEDLDDAAKRVLKELTGLKNVKMSQFKAYGSKNRTRNPKDVMWLERFYQLRDKKVDRIVTIAYLSLLKIDPRYERLSDKYDACWTPVGQVTSLAFDHLQIMQDALAYVRQYVEMSPPRMFDLLPRKFTVAQLRSLYQVIYNREFDVRNFHKRLAQMPYVLALDEKEVGVSHRAARYYKFDRTIYNKVSRT